MDSNISKMFQWLTQKPGNAIFIVQVSLDNRYQMKVFTIRMTSLHQVYAWKVQHFIAALENTTILGKAESSLQKKRNELLISFQKVLLMKSRTVL